MGEEGPLDLCAHSWVSDVAQVTLQGSAYLRVEQQGGGFQKRWGIFPKNNGSIFSRLFRNRVRLLLSQYGLPH